MKVLKNKSSSEFVFVNARQQPWTVNAMRLRIARIKPNTDLAKDVFCRPFRHAWGTNAILKGIDQITVATCMGHSSLEMISKVYVHLADKHEHLQQATEEVGRSSGILNARTDRPDLGPKFIIRFSATDLKCPLSTLKPSREDHFF